MSALPSIADIRQRIEHVCFVPIADIQHEASIGRAKPVADACLPYYVGLDTSSHTCSVVTEMKPGMKNMGQFETKDEAEKAMADMKECKGAM